MIVAFTGHRPDKLGGYGSMNPVRAALKKAIRVELEYIHAKTPIECVMSGMALGTDQWGAEGLKLSAAVQGTRKQRNAFMVERCDMLIAVFDGSKGGTMNCVNYAIRRGKTTLFISPGPDANWNEWANMRKLK